MSQKPAPNIFQEHLSDQQIADYIFSLYRRNGVVTPPKVEVISIHLNPELIASPDKMEALIRTTLPDEVIKKLGINELVKRLSRSNDFSYSVAEDDGSNPKICYVFSRPDRYASLAMRLSEISGIALKDIHPDTEKKSCAEYDNLQLLLNCVKGVQFATIVGRYKWPEQAIQGARLESIEYFLQNGGDSETSKLYTNAMAIGGFLQPSVNYGFRLYGFLHPISLRDILSQLKKDVIKIGTRGSPMMSATTASFPQIVNGLISLHDELYNACDTSLIPKIKTLHRLVHSPNTVTDAERQNVAHSTGDEMHLMMRMVITTQACQALQDLLGSNLKKYAPDKALASVHKLQRQMRAGLM
jgi:hypothetical protein